MATSRTEKFQFPYLAEAGKITPNIERDRFVTLDVQLEALFTILGNGIISGWELSLTGQPVDDVVPDAINNTINIKPGKGNINYMAAETLIWTSKSDLQEGYNYIYATTDEDTPLTKVPIFFTSNIPLSQDNIISLGIVNVVDGVCQTPLDGDRNDIGFLNVLFNTLLVHKHGKDGIPQVDLSSEVKGILSSDNLADIPAERITTGIISPERFSMSHSDLLDSGVISHEDIDSLIEKLQKSNQRLFGDISATNLLKLIIEMKKVYPTCDRFFRNLFVIVPGLDNNTFDNPKTFFEPSSAYDKNLYDDGEDSYTSLYDVDGNGSVDDVIVFRPDAAIVNFNDGYITGVEATGRSMHEYSIDTEPEFNRGTYDPDYIEVTSLGSSWQYGYGYGYGEGLDFFDVYGIVSGNTDEYGQDSHYGYGLPYFESEFAGMYGYGYGYEYMFGTATTQTPGNVSVRLKRGNINDEYYIRGTTDLNQPSSYSNDSSVQAYTDLEDRYWNDDTTSVLGKMVERFHYEPTSESGGNVIQESITGTRAAYVLSAGDDSNFSHFQKLFLIFSPSVVPSTPYMTVPMHKRYVDMATDLWVACPWWIQLEDSNGKRTTPYKLFDVSDDIEILHYGSRYDYYNVKLTDNAYTAQFSIETLTADPESGFDVTDVKKIRIVAMDTSNALNSQSVDYTAYVPKINDFTIDDPMGWFETNLSKIGVGGEDTYSYDETNNSISELYIVVPETAHLETISWLASEPTDSRVLIYIKCGDSLTTATFGSAYMNKARLTETARPSGSACTEPDGTYIELKAVLQPSIDYGFTPELHSITLRYSTEGGVQEVTYTTDEDFSHRNKIVNITVQDNELELTRYDEINKRRFGQVGQFQVLNSNWSVDNTQPDYYGHYLPKTLDEYISESESSSYGLISSIKRMSDGNLAIADSTKDRIVIVNAQTNAFVKGFYGPKSYSASVADAPTFKLAFVHYNRTSGIVYVGFSHIVTDPNINLWTITNMTTRESFVLDSDAAAGREDSVSILNCNNTVTGGGILKVTLSELSKQRINSYIDANGTLKLSINMNGSTPGISHGQVPIADDDTSLGGTAIELWDIYYDLISIPIDLKVDSSDNILIAQANVENYNMSGMPVIYKFNPDSPPSAGGTALINISKSDENNFQFDRSFFGSVEEVVNSSGEVVLLVADCNNRKVVLYNIDSVNKTSLVIYSPTSSGFYPTCATMGTNGYYYISISDKGSGNNGSIIEHDGNSVINTYLEGDVNNPRDVYYIASLSGGQGKLLISS